MSEVIKFTEEEMQEIAQLQSKFQEKIFLLGQLQVDELSLQENKNNLENRKQSVIDELKGLRNDENDIVNKLASKYGNGSLNLKDGSFTPAENDGVQQSQPVTTEPTQSIAGNVGIGTDSGATYNTESISGNVGVGTTGPVTSTSTSC